VEQARHQGKTRRRIVARGRDLLLSRRDRACVVAHRREGTRDLRAMAASGDTRR